MSIGLGPKVHIFAVPYQINSDMVASATALLWRLDLISSLFLGSSSLCVRFRVVCVFHFSLVQVLLICLLNRVGFLLRRVQK